MTCNINIHRNFLPSHIVRYNFKYIVVNLFLKHLLFFSLFVLLKGATKEEAFSIGKDIVDTVTAMNPKPVKLKFEKVCLMQRLSRKIADESMI